MTFNPRHIFRRLLLGTAAPVLLALTIGAGAASSPAAATDLTIGAGGRVSLELLGSNAKFHNTLAVVAPDVAVEARGCKLEPATGLPQVHALSEKISQRGCRVTLDSDPSTPGVQGFAAGTTFELRLCAQTDKDADCEFVWASDPDDNSDDFDHVITTELFPNDLPGQVYRLAWEDLEDGGDNDFDDLIAVLRVEQDSDGDGLWDDWERFGIDTNGDGSIDLDLPALGANPLRKDLFLEIDWMDCAIAGGDCTAGDTHNHRPDPAAVTAVIQSFAGANVSNPDGSTGITLHVDVNNAMAHQQFLRLPTPNCLGGTQGEEFDAVKADAANFGTDNPRRFAYRYGLFSHLQTSTSTSSGCGELGGNDFVVSMGGFPGQVGTIQQQAGTLMHEFGHNLGLLHGGADSVNFKPNYLSVMSYRYQLAGIPPTDPAGPLTARIDYSRSDLNDLVESALSEPAGIGGTTNDNVFWGCPGGARATGVANAALNWNCDADSIDNPVSVDLNGDGTNTLTGFFDWGNVLYAFQSTNDYEDGDHSSAQEPDIDFETYQEMVAPELSLALAAAPATVLTGANVTFTLTVTNRNPEMAHDVVVHDSLPATTAFVSCTVTDGGICGGNGRNRVVTFPKLAGGASATITLVANVDCAVTDGTVISNSASVSFPQPDPDPSNDSATATVTAANPTPSIGNMTADKTQLWPPNHKMVDVALGYQVTDNCGVPTCALDVASNEPVNGSGDGNTAPDWEILDDHHVRLRAERSGQGTGRLYTLGATCTDSAGSSARQTVTVAVPHNR
jgi:uncharacterized repeat protein (TIGR01451 family)